MIFFIENPDGFIYAAILMARYVIQVVRFVIFWRKQREVMRSKTAIVDFGRVGSDANSNVDNYFD